jgi:hypothetical protein
MGLNELWWASSFSSRAPQEAGWWAAGFSSVLYVSGAAVFQLVHRKGSRFFFVSDSMRRFTGFSTGST